MGHVVADSGWTGQRVIIACLFAVSLSVTATPIALA